MLLLQSWEKTSAVCCWVSSAVSSLVFFFCLQKDDRIIELCRLEELSGPISLSKSIYKDFYMCLVCINSNHLVQEHHVYCHLVLCCCVRSEMICLPCWSGRDVLSPVQTQISQPYRKASNNTN